MKTNNRLQTAIAVIAFAGTPDNFAFRITGPETENVSPRIELERFIHAIDMRAQDLDPFALQLMAAGILDSRLMDVQVAMDFDEADIPTILASCELTELRTL